MKYRPRRLRNSAAIRQLVSETQLSAAQLVYPLFVQDQEPQPTPIKSMPGVVRHTLESLATECQKAYELGIRTIALFPVIQDQYKTDDASHALSDTQLGARAIQHLKKLELDLTIIADIALDPFSSAGHDGLVKNGVVLNDDTVDVLAQQAVLYARAGADIVAPSDMMDGRVGAIREALDHHGFHSVSIMSYAAKYASQFYGPFRDALDSAPRSGDKKTYQMNPSNSQEALREVALDIEEGADLLLIKPGLPYLDIVNRVSQSTHLPVGVYHVSGEYTMIELLAQQTGQNRLDLHYEALLSCRRAGAQFIFSYAACDMAHYLNQGVSQ